MNEKSYQGIRQIALNAIREIAGVEVRISYMKRFLDFWHVQLHAVDTDGTRNKAFSLSIKNDGNLMEFKEI